jgi:hypothetical protein
MAMGDTMYHTESISLEEVFATLGHCCPPSACLRFDPSKGEAMQKTHAHNGHARTLSFMPFDLNDARERLSGLGTQATGYIRKKPAVALLGALCLGFVLSRLLSRR